MMEKLSFTQKKYGLIALALLLAWASWRLAFKKTVIIFQKYRELSGQTEVGQDLSYPAGYTLRKQANLDKVLEGYRQDSTTFRDSLLYLAAFHAARQDVKIVQVPTQESTANSTVLQKIVFQGGYSGLIRLLSELKRTKGIGRIRFVKIRNAGQGDKLSQTVMEVYFLCLPKNS